MVAFEKQVRRSNAIRFDANACVETRLIDVSAATWYKSSYSACNGNCVEVASLRHGLIAVRDTKDVGQGPVLIFEDAAWKSFLEGVKKDT